MSAASFHHQTSAGDDSDQAYSQGFEAGGLRRGVSPLTELNQFNILKVAGSIAVLALVAYLGYRMFKRRG